MDRADVGMAEGRRRASFLPEPLYAQGVGSQLLEREIHASCTPEARAAGSFL
jgi:hypothetical protein